MSDPTRSLDQRTPDEIGEYLDDHLLMAMEAAYALGNPPFAVEDLIRDRLVALADTYTDEAAVHTESRRRTNNRLRDLLSQEH
jgi:hypothetical protein